MGVVAGPGRIRSASGASRASFRASGYGCPVPTTCLLCQRPLVIQPGAEPLGKRANSYDNFWEACPRCAIALSNATGPARTFIRRDWRDGLWRRSTAQRLEAILDCSLNIRSRRKKKARLAHERSEDLLTWNAFSWLED